MPRYRSLNVNRKMQIQWTNCSGRGIESFLGYDDTEAENIAMWLEEQENYRRSW